MINKLIKVVVLIFRPRLLRFVFSIPYGGFLKEVGWVDSFEKRMPIDEEGNPLPWVTYPFIEFIKERLSGVECLFEFGSGNSTLFYSHYVRKVDVIEHDECWYNLVADKMPSNVNIFLESLEYGGGYCKGASITGEKYDLIIVDGRDRVNCVVNSLESLSEIGVVVLDDSERSEYQEAITFMLNNSFKKIDFWGVSPGQFYVKNTTVFYKEGNALYI